MTALMHLVADYGADELPYAELLERLALVVSDYEVVLTRVGRCDTIAAGYCVARLALSPGPDGRIVIHDVAEAPPGGSAGGPEACRLCFGRSRTGAWVVGPNTGWTWSFVAGELCRPHFMDVSVAKAPSRSPQPLAAAIARALGHHKHALGEPVPRGSIPPVPAPAVRFARGRGLREPAHALRT